MKKQTNSQEPAARVDFVIAVPGQAEKKLSLVFQTKAGAKRRKAEDTFRRLARAAHKSLVLALEGCLDNPPGTPTSNPKAWERVQAARDRALLKYNFITPGELKQVKQMYGER